MALSCSLWSVIRTQRRALMRIRGDAFLSCCDCLNQRW
jgi:hypothetical protein